jgi:hypothetical protein
VQSTGVGRCCIVKSMCLLGEEYIDPLPEWSKLLKPLNSFNLYIIFVDGDVEMDCKLMRTNSDQLIFEQRVGSVTFTFFIVLLTLLSLL